MRATRCVSAMIAVLAAMRTGLSAEQPSAFFRERVEPLLVRRCLECHGADRSGGLDLRTRADTLKGGESGAAAVSGDADDSLLVQYAEDGTMPPEHELTAAEKVVLRKWVADGLEFPERPLDAFAFTTEHRAGYDWWSLQPIEKPPVPTPRNTSAARTPIDRFIRAKLEQSGLAPVAEADRATLVQRLSYDLTGLRPTYAEVRAFVDDPRPDAYERLVDRLLASPHYGERWGRHWLDVVRFAESNGFERDRIRRNAWPYRDYVIRAFNENRSYDRFVLEQLAGDALDPAAPDLRIATGYLVAGPKNDVATVSELERLRTRQDELDEYVVATTSTFLGLTGGCARCHDHKFDPITARDYYALTAVFSGLDRGDVVVASTEAQRNRAATLADLARREKTARARRAELLTVGRERVLAKNTTKDRSPKLAPVDFVRNEDTFTPVETKWLRFVVTATTGNSQPCLDEIEVYGPDAKSNLAHVSTGAKASASSLLPGYPIHQVHHLNDGQLGNERSWISNEPGTGWAAIEFPEPVEISRVVWGRDRKRRYRDRLPTAYRIEVSNDGKTWKAVSDSSRRIAFGKAATDGINETAAIAMLNETERAEATRLRTDLTAIDVQRKALPPLATGFAARDNPPRPSWVLRRGDVRSREDAVQPAAIAGIRSLTPALKPETDNGPNRRLALARWIADPRNPLTARVFVNRVWHHHFGHGLVNTPSDFGFNGGRPSHPKLLDWLAADFVAHGWDVKRLHRQIVLSTAYRRGNTFDERAAAVDRDNRLLWRMTPRRLDSESLRDAILRAAGVLDTRMGGPSFSLFRYRDGNVPDYQLIENPGPETYRRGVYAYNIRTFSSPLMAVFDCPDPSVQTPVRSSSTTPLQALSLMNNPFVFRQGRALADRVRREADSSEPAALVTRAYEITLRRRPTDEERASAAAFVDEHDLFSLCRVLLNANEFLYVP